MKTFTAAMTASELKIKGELVIERLKDLDGALHYAALNMPKNISSRERKRILFAFLTRDMQKAIEMIVDVMNAAYEAVSEDEKSSEAPRES